MPNPLITAIAQNKETFKESRVYLLSMLKKEQIIEMEQKASEPQCLPYYINFLEHKGIDINEAVIYFKLELPTMSYWELLKITVVNTFRKLENGDTNFIPY